MAKCKNCGGQLDSECDACRGKGYVVLGPKCSHCDGKGGDCPGCS